MTRDEIIDVLEFAGVKTELAKTAQDYDYQRCVDFTVNDTDYRIVWFANTSTLKERTDRGWEYPFRYVKFDDCYPMVGGNHNLTFSADGQHDFYSFRLALPMPQSESK